MGLKEKLADGDVLECGGTHDDVYRGGETAHEEALVRADGLENSTEAKRALRQANLSSDMRGNYRFTFELCSISIQTILLVVFLPVFRYEPAHKGLQIWIIGTGIGCLLCRTYDRFRELQFRELLPKRLPQAVLTVFPGSEVAGKSLTGRCQRFGIQVLEWLWGLLDGFFPLGVGVGTGIAYTRWTTGQAPHLNWLCTLYLVIACSPYILGITACIMTYIWLGIRKAKAFVISALPTFQYHLQVCDLEANQASNKEDDNNVRGITIGGYETRVGALAAAADYVVECLPGALRGWCGVEGAALHASFSR